MKRLFKRLIKFAIIIGLFTIASNLVVEIYSVDRTFNKTSDVYYNKVGLLLGTSKYLKNGQKNLFYTYRIDAAVRLFKSGKIKYIIVSGDNGSETYDEPTTFKNDLVQRGIPSSRIYLDYAGFRTLDSIVRSKEIFGQESITVISQQFHNERAITLAEAKGIKAIGYNAKNVGGQSGIKVKVREAFARVKLMMDIMTFKSPKFLGKPVHIPS